MVGLLRVSCGSLFVAIELSCILPRENVSKACQCFVEPAFAAIIAASLKTVSLFRLCTLRN